MKLWGGRFTGRRDPQFEKFSESFSLDQRFVLYDLRANLAYVQALRRARALKPGEAARLTTGLNTLARKVSRKAGWAEGESAEDIHTWVENELERIVGGVAGKLRTGRSRNDLVATEMRMYVKDSALHLMRALAELMDALVHQARRHLSVILPGYTHLQPAQPILFAHYLLAYFEMFTRDCDRLADFRARADELPMGAGALAGTAFAIDREHLAKSLGFARVARNTLDVTCDRDPAAELVFACALCMIHLSRLAEDLIIYSSPGFGYVELADAYSTGSSIMPQKKNPDSMELIRGRSGAVLGNLAGLLAVMKGLPSAYDRDLQEDKSAMFAAVDTSLGALQIAGRVIATLRINPDRMKAMTELGFLTATDLADELVRRGEPFASAHEQVGKLVQHCVTSGKTFRDLSAEEAAQFVPGWNSHLYEVATSVERSVARRDVTGGTAPKQVARQLVHAEKTLAGLQRTAGVKSRKRQEGEYER
jgi:argininosuccinate lyase